MNKIVINHLDKLFITSDAATIIKEVEVHHPASKMVAMAAKMQENEVGDGTNFVISLAGELMNQIILNCCITHPIADFLFCLDWPF